VGGAGSTGKGEENIKISGAHTIVEMMRKGMKPTGACLEALPCGRNGYEQSKRAMFALHDGEQARLLPCQPFFDEIGGGE